MGISQFYNILILWGAYFLRVVKANTLKKNATKLFFLFIEKFEEFGA
jgi:hypothetical protein